jgi:hypothetical protein
MKIYEQEERFTRMICERTKNESVTRVQIRRRHRIKKKKERKKERKEENSEEDMVMTTVLE